MGCCGGANSAGTPTDATVEGSEAPGVSVSPQERRGSGDDGWVNGTDSTDDDDDDAGTIRDLHFAAGARMPEYLTKRRVSAATANTEISSGGGSRDRPSLPPRPDISTRPTNWASVAIRSI